jgi:PDZ domain-containing protein
VGAPITTPPRRRLNLTPRTITMLVSAVATVGLGAAMFALPVPYVLETPGPTLDTLGEQDGVVLVQVPEEPSHPLTGQLLLTTVGAIGSEPGSLNLLRLVRGYLSGDEALLPYDVVYAPGQTTEEREEQSAQQMSSSQYTAEVAALEELGYTVTPVVEGIPEGHVLQLGDKLLAVNGVPITGYGQLIDLMDSLEGGSTVTVQVERDGQTADVEVVTQGGEGEPARLGVAVGFDTPVEVTYGIENIGGPSAGTMFALAIIDKLGDEDLAAGNIVAGTGTMDADGSVGAIGGIRQKMIGADEAGATLFLAPKANCDEVQGHVPDGLQVVAIETLDDAVAALEAMRDGVAGTLPSCDVK